MAVAVSLSCPCELVCRCAGIRKCILSAVSWHHTALTRPLCSLQPQCLFSHKIGQRNECMLLSKDTERI